MRVDYAVYMAATDETMPLVDAARAAEDLGFESLWVPEHVHMPVKRETPYPFSPDGRLPGTHYRLLDPFVALAHAAGATERIKFATGICLVTEHEPLALAKQVASLDLVSGGRFIFGVGAGWLGEEMEPMGVPFAKRWRVTEERVAAMKALWTQDEAAFHGDFVDFPATHSYPKPITKPHPPIYIGAISKWALERVAAWGDGWLPNRPDPEFLAAGMAEIRRRSQAHGRDPDAIGTTLFGLLPDLVYGQPELLDALERVGVERCVFVLPREGADVVAPALERLAEFLAARATD